MLLHFTSLILAATVSVTPPAVTHTDVRTVADSQPALTTDALAHMTTFWSSFMKLPDSVKTVGRKANQEQLPLTIGPQKATLPGVVNIIAMAAKYPSVAEALKQSGLTAQQWNDYRNSLFAANMVQQAGATSQIPATTTLGKNIAFLTAHQQEFTALKATGMWFPQVQQQGMGDDGSDLNP